MLEGRRPGLRTASPPALPSLEEPAVPVTPVVIMVIVVMMMIVVIVVVVVMPVVPRPVSATDFGQLGRSQRLQPLLGQGQFLRFPCPH